MRGLVSCSSGLKVWGVRAREAQDLQSSSLAVTLGFEVEGWQLLDGTLFLQLSAKRLALLLPRRSSTTGNKPQASVHNCAC